jgi:serine phosphatase RsbU (regulator of sigma subunit)
MSGTGPCQPTSLMTSQRLPGFVLNPVRLNVNTVRKEKERVQSTLDDLTSNPSHEILEMMNKAIGVVGQKETFKQESIDKQTALLRELSMVVSNSLSNRLNQNLQLTRSNTTKSLPIAQNLENLNDRSV